MQELILKNEVSQSKIEAKGLEYNVFLGDDKQDGYQTNNFHNQYVQIFAEIGVFGFVLLLLPVLPSSSRYLYAPICWLSSLDATLQYYTLY